mmetsp:Transcript_61771/g.143727  ORF Transcript_61771/g.143727 Transcript_61771/m.143727 type:complete len:239 (+) Transcript_61771:105-821(+)
MPHAVIAAAALVVVAVAVAPGAGGLDDRRLASVVEVVVAANGDRQQLAQTSQRHAAGRGAPESSWVRSGKVGASTDAAESVEPLSPGTGPPGKRTTVGDMVVGGASLATLVIGPERGDPGDRGPPGPKGKQGITGATGPMGPDGHPGQKGKRGEAGRDGEAGPPGPQGKPGTKGEPGAPAPSSLPASVATKTMLIAVAAVLLVGMGVLYCVLAEKLRSSIALVKRQMDHQTWDQGPVA